MKSHRGRMWGILLLTLLLSSPVYAARQEVYSQATPSDEGIYLYFSDILKDAESSLDKFLDEDAATVNLSLSLEHRLELTEDESMYYSSKGIDNVSYVLPPFTSLSRAINRLVLAQADFLENIQGDIAKARYAVAQMRIAAHDVNTSLSRIEKKELWNGTSKLYFDVSRLRDRLGEIYDLIDYYEGQLPPQEGSLFIVVSDEQPILYEEITIYVHARNVTPTFLFIDGMGYKINTSSKKYSFGELGRHVIYAEGIRDGNLLKSNTVEIYVGKIPTSIMLSSKLGAFLNEVIKVTGILSDYYGNLLNESLTVEVNGENREFRTKNGFFVLNVTRPSEGFLNISAFYDGNETYHSSNASISIFFSRFPVTLYIASSKTRISINESVNFAGRIYGANHSLPIHISMNSASIKMLNATEEFAFSLNFSRPGRYLILAYFPGDLVHMPAESNKIEVVVSSGSDGTIFQIIARLRDKPYILGIIALILIVAYFLFSIRKRWIELKIGSDKKVKEEVIEKPEEEISPKPRPTFIESAENAYDALFKALVIRYNLKKSLTPRELLKELKSEPFAEKLKVVTELHERAVYGGAKLKDEDRFIRLIAELLEVME